MKIPESELVADIVRLLTPTGMVSTHVPIRSALAEWAQGRFEMRDRAAAANRAFDLIVLIVSKKEPPNAEKRPLTAAYHLLALGTYEDDHIVEDTGLTLRFIRLTSGPAIMGTDPRQRLGLRQRIAAIAGHYGDERTTLGATKPRIAEIARAILREMQAIDTPHTLAAANDRPVATQFPSLTPAKSAPQHGIVQPTDGVLSRENQSTQARLHIRRVAVMGIVGLMLLLAYIGLPHFFTPPSASPTKNNAYAAPSRSTIPSSNSYLAGWGPARKTFTVKGPATYAVLNSIIDNPAQGGERNFVQVRVSTAADDTYADLVAAHVGDSLVFFVYVANDAADNFTDSPGTIQGLTAKLSQFQDGTNLGVQVILDATNAKSVWDGVNILCPQAARLRYVSNSLQVHSFDNTAESLSISDSLFARGSAQPIGVHGDDGTLPVGLDAKGRELGAMWLTFRMQVVGQ